MQFVFEERRSDSPAVELLWRTQSVAAGAFVSRAVTQWEIVIAHYQGATHFTLRGPETRATLAPCPADAAFFGIQFKLGTFMPHVPIARLVDDQVTLPAATHRSFWLHGAAWELPTFENADVFVNRLLRQGILVRDPVVEVALQVHTPALSLRSLQYHFVQATGLPHKTIQQIERAHRAVALLEHGTPIVDTAFDLGYCDQAHLTNALQRFVGKTPAHIAQQRRVA